MAFLNRYKDTLNTLKSGLLQRINLFAQDPQGYVDNASELYRLARSAYRAGSVIYNKPLPARPTSYSTGIQFAKDTLSYMSAVQEVTRTKVEPAINSMLLLASGNRDFDSAAIEVGKAFDDATTLAIVDEAVGWADKIRSIFDDEELTISMASFTDAAVTLVTNLNRDAIVAQLESALEAVRVSAPGSKIAPNGKVYIDAAIPWILTTSSQNIGGVAGTVGTPTGDLGTAALSHTAAKWVSAFQFNDNDASGYHACPPADGAYDWNAVVSFFAVLTNANGGAVGGDVLTVNNDFFSIRVWTAETLGGTAIKEAFYVIKNGAALTAAGAEVFNVSADVGVEVSPSAADSSYSQWVHVDYAFGNVVTAGANGLAATSVHTSNVRLIGVLDEKEVDYTEVTYRDNTNVVRTIGKSDSFSDYLGMLTMNPYDDPNLSVPALYARRFGSKSTLLGAVVSAISDYSSRYHAVGSRIDDKYNKLGCTNGMKDMIGTDSLFDYTAPPYGSATAVPISDMDDQAYLQATFTQDIKLFLTAMRDDARMQSIAAKYLSYTSSSNVHYI
jgi:hypothetical protein